MKKKKEEEKKHARGYFAALIGDLTVAGLRLYEQCGIFLRCHSRLLRMVLSPKKPQCSPKFNSRISAGESGEKGGEEKHRKIWPGCW